VKPEPGELRFVVLDSLEEIGPDRWRDVCRRSRDATVFQSFEWLQSWWQAYGTVNNETWILAAFDGERLVGLAPLCTGLGSCHRRFSGARALQFMGGDHSDYHTFVCDDNYPGLARQMFAELLTRTKGHFNVELCDVPEWSELGSVLQKSSATWLGRCLGFDETPCPRIVFSQRDGLFDALLRKRSLKRHANALKRLGFVSVDHLQDPEEIYGHLEHFFRQHLERWSVTSHPSLFASERAKEFYRQLTLQLAQTGNVVFTVVSLNGDPVAFHYGLISKGEFIWYKPTFDVTHWREAPGETLLKELLTLSKANGYRVFDFTRGGESFKSRFANETRSNFSFHVYPNALSALFRRLVDLAKDLLRSVRDRLRARHRPGNERESLEELASRAAAAGGGSGLEAYSWSGIAGVAANATSGGTFREANLKILLGALTDPSLSVLQSRLPLAYEYFRKQQRCFLLYESGAGQSSPVGWVWYGDVSRCVGALQSGGVSASTESRECFHSLEIWRPEIESRINLAESLSRLATAFDLSERIVAGHGENRRFSAAAEFLPITLPRGS